MKRSQEVETASNQHAETRFVIFSVARSGTSFLTTSLRSHPEILCHGEALLPRHFHKHVHGSARSALSKEEVENDPLNFLYKLFELSDGCRAVGCKVFRGHSTDIHFDILKDPGIRKIVLHRENHLASYASLLMARKTGKWNSKRPSVSQDKVTFVADEFSKYSSRIRGFFNKIERESVGPTLFISYKDTIMKNDVQKVLDFLEVSREFETASRLVKMHGSEIIDRFENREEVLSCLREIGHEEWVYE